MVAGSGRPTMYIVAYESKALNAPTLKARLKSEAGALLRGPPLLALSSLGPPRKNEDILCAALSVVSGLQDALPNLNSIRIASSFFLLRFTARTLERRPYRHLADDHFWRPSSLLARTNINMKLNTALVALSFVGTAEAFAPQPMAAGTQRASLTELEMANGAKRKAALKAAKKVAGAVGSVALATAGLPPAARAAEAAVDSAKGAKNVVTVGAGAFAAGVAANKLLENLDIGSIPETADKIEEVFPGAKSNKKLVKEAASALKEFGYGKDSLVATSLCADEVNRVLEEDFSKVFGDNFSMGGLAGECQ